MARFEIGRIINLGGNKENTEEVPKKRPIGFINPETSTEEGEPREKHKLDHIGFSSSSEAEEDKEDEDSQIK